jgi:DNA-binding XRE family transcriptional regulator
MLGIASFFMACYIWCMNAETKIAEYRAYRKSLGLTQARLAELLGVGRDTIVARETGKSRLIDEHWLALEGIRKGQRNEPI